MSGTLSGAAVRQAANGTTIMMRSTALSFHAPWPEQAHLSLALRRSGLDARTRVYPSSAISFVQVGNSRLGWRVAAE